MISSCNFRFTLDQNVILGGKYEVQVLHYTIPFDQKPGQQLVARSGHLGLSPEDFKALESHPGASKLVWIAEEDGEERAEIELGLRKQDFEYHGPWLYEVNKDLTKLCLKMQQAREKAEAETETEARKQAEAIAARVREAVASDIKSVQDEVVKFASAVKDNECSTLREQMALKQELTSSQDLTDERIEKVLDRLVAMEEKFSQMADAQSAIMKKLDDQSKTSEEQMTASQTLQKELNAQLKKEMSQTWQDLHVSHATRVEKELAELRQELKSSLKEVDGRLTSELKQVTESIKASTKQHNDEAVVLKDALNALDALQKEQQQLLGDQLKADGAKVRGDIEHLQEKVQKSHDSLADRLTKFEKELGEDLKVLKEQFQTRGAAQEQRATELQQDLAKLAKEIQKEQRELTKPMQDSLESIKRSQSELERKLAKHAEDVDCQMQEDFIAREESLTSLKY